jgi:fatty acid-binding protein DegV
VEGGREAIMRELREQIRGRRGTEFAVAHTNAPEHATWFRERIVDEFAPERDPFIAEATSVLAAHVGEGAVGLAYLLPEIDA